MSKNAWIIAGIAASGITAALALREVLKPVDAEHSTVKTSQSSPYSKKSSRRSDGGGLFDGVSAAIGTAVATVGESVSNVADNVSSYTPSHSSHNDSSTGGGSYDGGGASGSFD